MRFRLFLTVLAASLCLAAPAYAQSPAVPDEAPVCEGVGDTTTSCSSGGDPADQPETVGDPEVITDPADEIEGPPREDSGDTEPQRGELHVLGSREASSSQAPAPAPAVAAAQAPAESAPADQQIRTSAHPKGQLPFTGPDAGPLALIGLMLLAGGLGLRRVARV
jgi:hypothetical protein